MDLDSERAASGPFGRTVAHGYLTLSLVPAMVRELVRVDGAALVVNAGNDRVRFIEPVRSGDRIRATATVLGAERVPLGIRLAQRIEVEIENAGRPALIADTIALFLIAHEEATA